MTEVGKEESLGKKWYGYLPNNMVLCEIIFYFSLLNWKGSFIQEAIMNKDIEIWGTHKIDSITRGNIFPSCWKNPHNFLYCSDIGHSRQILNHKLSYSLAIFVLLKQLVDIKLFSVYRNKNW